MRFTVMLALPLRLEVLTLENHARFGFIGFGALAQAFAAGLRDGGGADVAVYARPRQDPAAADALAARLHASGVRRCSSVADAVEGADVVIAAVPAAAA